jgi:carboxylesterase
MKKSHTKKRWKRILLILVPVIIVLFVVFQLFKLSKTYGILQMSSMDDRDLARWEYEDGLIKGADALYLEGAKEHYWIIVHGYLSSALEMKGLGQAVHDRFNDTVSVMRLSGHGEVPSALLGKSAEMWYEEIQTEYDNMNEQCKKVNVAGSSLGALMLLRLSQEEELGNVYLLSPYLYAYPVDSFISIETQLKLCAWFTNFEIKPTPGTISDPEGLAVHIGYMNMPMDPFKDSLSFVRKTEEDLSQVEENVLIQQSRGDTTSDPKSSQTIYDNIASSDKELIWYERSNHLLLMDYDKEDVISNIIEFESERR